MNDIANELRLIVEDAAAQLQATPEPSSRLPEPGGDWSAKQLLGHLIDSAANNHQRFVRAQFMDDLVFPGYDQEQWVAAQHYLGETWPALVELWRLHNLHLAHVLDQIPTATLTQPRHPHSLDTIAWQRVSADESATLEYLACDYIGHLRAHLAQLFAMLQPLIRLLAKPSELIL